MGESLQESLLRDLIEEIGLEDILLEQGLDPVDALTQLYLAGVFDLERFLMKYEENNDYSNE